MEEWRAHKTAVELRRLGMEYALQDLQNPLKAKLQLLASPHEEHLFVISLLIHLPIPRKRLLITAK